MEREKNPISTSNSKMKISYHKVRRCGLVVGCFILLFSVTHIKYSYQYPGEHLQVCGY